MYYILVNFMIDFVVRLWLPSSDGFACVTSDISHRGGGGFASVDFFGALWWCVVLASGSCLSLVMGYESGGAGSARVLAVKGSLY